MKPKIDLRGPGGGIIIDPFGSSSFSSYHQKQHQFKVNRKIVLYRPLNITSVSETIQKPPIAKVQTALGKQKYVELCRDLSNCRNSVKNCFPEQTFTEIRKSADELWRKTIFNSGRPQI